MVFRFRMLSDENDNFVRDYEVLYDTTLLEFHDFILRSLEYEECMASFFTADDRWEKLREFTRMDMDDGAEDAPLAMEKVTLGQIIHNNRDRLIYLFDIFGDRAYFLELTGSFESKPGISYPREIYVQAEAPDQYDPSKNVVSGEGSTPRFSRPIRGRSTVGCLSARPSLRPNSCRQLSIILLHPMT